ncbi:hypothetical protein [Dictyobacter aurantiacus]|uniref:Uncharacterized protein n=1 Tax=Dictyobacter aurantiacus TaxID=1936993 RepID=A0A401Z9W9_9CHLR|nr:hypothetical protein [Dictyobacter aurantiacus]GCE03657.1 hypothetical protein KDAU_09860 [Dictyobacter aurantiacus]
MFSMNRSRMLSIAFMLCLVAGFAGLPAQASAHAASPQLMAIQSGYRLSHSYFLQNSVLVSDPATPPTAMGQTTAKTTVLGGQGTIAAKTTNGGYVACNANAHIVGGGYALLDKDGKPTTIKDVFVLASSPSKAKDGTDTWAVAVNNGTASPITVAIYAICIA